MEEENRVEAAKPETPDAAKVKSDKALELVAAIGAVFLFLFCQFVFSLVGLAIAAAMNAEHGVSQAELMQSLSDTSVIALPAIWATLISNIFVLGILWLFLRRGNRLQRLGWHRWSVINWWKTAALFVICVAAALSFNYVYTNYIFPDLDMQGAMRELFAAIPQTLGNQLLLFLTVAVVAPIVEEVIFRGLLQNSLANYLPPWAAIILSAFIFALIHFQPEALGPLMALGAAFGVIYHITKSLRVTILLHVFNNAAALALEPLAQQAREAEKAVAAMMPLLG